MKTDNAIFYIKYYAKKHGEIIERKATLDDNGCGEFKHKKYGYPYFFGSGLRKFDPVITRPKLLTAFI